MNDMERGIVTLLKSAVTGECLTLPEEFDLESAYPLIQRHHVTALIFEGAMNCGVPMSLPIMRRLSRDYGKNLLVSERQLEMLGRLYAAFQENEIAYMPLKGCNMKHLYPKPELRAMGDADILIRMEQYDRIVPLMQALGFREGSVTDHELHWEHDSLHLELHKLLIPSYNKDLAPYFGDGWKLAGQSTGTCWAMSPEDEWIYLFTHFAKHYRDGGVGCRHVLDLWVYLRANPGLDEGYISGVLKQLRLLEFYQNIRRLLEVWFGDAPMDDRVEVISIYLFASGSWGDFSSRAKARLVRDSRHSVLGFSGKLLYAMQTLFPGVDVLKEKYTILKKAPVLLPFVWVYRVFLKLLVERDSLDFHKNTMRGINKESLASRQDMMDFVGIGYHF